MKKILIVIHDMQIGGAQRSLLSFLNSLCASLMAEQYEVDLMVINPAGPFYDQIPQGVRLMPPPEELRWLGTSVNTELFCKHFTWNSFIGEIGWLLKKRANQNLNLQQRLWKCWQKRIPQLQTAYDVAISYMDGVPNYYVVDKVTAKKKVLWVHSEYQKQGYNREFDRCFFEAAQMVVTISPNCRECILQEFPELREKTCILENITDRQEILKKSKAGSCPEFDDGNKLRLLSVARLNRQKGIDLAVEAASQLKKEGIPFVWLVTGDGPEFATLQAQIKKEDLIEEFQLLGSRDNPYAYMAACDILVQPSRVEGKSIVLDEAKILCKPIVATNYKTVSDSLIHGHNGWIVEMNPESIAEGIKNLWQQDEARNTLIQKLENESRENTNQLRKYIDMML